MLYGCRRDYSGVCTADVERSVPLEEIEAIMKIVKSTLKRLLEVFLVQTY